MPISLACNIRLVVPDKILLITPVFRPAGRLRLRMALGYTGQLSGAVKSPLGQGKRRSGGNENGMLVEGKRKGTGIIPLPVLSPHTRPATDYLCESTQEE